MERFFKTWGVSFIINDDTLFDVFGKPSIFRRQLNKLSIDIAKIRNIVLSHDDWDHVSGLWYILERNRDVVVYICQNFSQDIKDKIKSYNVKIVEVKDFAEISRSIYSTGEMNGISDERSIYEQSLIVRSPKGIVLMTGCAHQGIANIVEKTIAKFGDKIYLLIGGMHLKDLSVREVDEVIIKLKSYNIRNIAPMHCTGRHATSEMKKAFGDNFIPIKQGTIINLE